MNAVRTRNGTWLALVAALLLVVQTLGNAWAIGAGPGAPMLDAFGNPLCITSAQDGDGGSQPVRHDCCPLGCSMQAQAIAAPPEPVAVAVSFETGPHVSDELRELILPPAREHDPGSPRAPPAIA